MLYVIGLWLLCVVWLVVALKRAPAGYENETGFHYGEAKR